MQAKLTAKAAQSITNLRNNQDWQVVLGWMADQSELWNQALIMSDAEDRRAVAAGMCRASALYFQAFEQAPQVLRGIKENG